MSNDTIIDLTELRYHRNGVSGQGFHVARFLSVDDSNEQGEFLATVFPDEGHCAVVRTDEYMDIYGVNMPNQYRGDAFEPALREAIADFNARDIASYNDPFPGDGPSVYPANARCDDEPTEVKTFTVTLEVDYMGYNDIADPWGWDWEGVVLQSFGDVENVTVRDVNMRD